MVTMMASRVRVTRVAVTILLTILALSAAATGWLAWDIVYFLGAPRISVYWIQYQSTAIVLFCTGMIGLVHIPSHWRAKYTLFVAGFCVFASVFLAPITELYISRVGVRTDTERVDFDSGIRHYAYLVDRYDENLAYYGPALQSADWMQANGYIHVSGIAYDRAFWVADGDHKPLTVARELAARMKDTLEGVKKEIYSLPYKQKLNEATQGIQRETDEFKHRQSEINKNGSRR